MTSLWSSSNYDSLRSSRTASGGRKRNEAVHVETNPFVHLPCKEIATRQTGRDVKVSAKQSAQATARRVSPRVWSDHTTSTHEHPNVYLHVSTIIQLAEGHKAHKREELRSAGSSRAFDSGHGEWADELCRPKTCRYTSTGAWHSRALEKISTNQREMAVTPTDVHHTRRGDPSRSMGLHSLLRIGGATTMRSIPSRQRPSTMQSFRSSSVASEERGHDSDAAAPWRAAPSREGCRSSLPPESWGTLLLAAGPYVDHDPTTASSRTRLNLRTASAHPIPAGTRPNTQNKFGILENHGLAARQGEAWKWWTSSGGGAGAPGQDHYQYETGNAVVARECDRGKRIILPR